MPTRSVALNSLAVLDSVAQTLPSEVDESPASENRYGSDLSLSWLPQGRFHRAGFVVASIQEPVQSFAVSLDAMWDGVVRFGSREEWFLRASGPVQRFCGDHGGMGRYGAFTPARANSAAMGRAGRFPLPRRTAPVFPVKAGRRSRGDRLPDYTFVMEARAAGNSVVLDASRRAVVNEFLQFSLVSSR
jgi:hypothetical protein